MCLQGRASLGLEWASIMACDAYGDTVDDVVPVAADSRLSGLVDVDDICSLGDFSLSRNADVQTSVHVGITAVQTRCLRLSLAVLNRAGDLLGLELRGLDASRESEESGMRVPSLEASGAEPLANIDASWRYDQETLHENRRRTNC